MGVGKARKDGFAGRELFDPLYSSSLLGCRIVVNPMRHDTQAYVHQNLEDHVMEKHPVTPENLRHRTVAVFNAYDPHRTGRVSYKQLYQLVFEFLSVQEPSPFNEMDTLWLGREFDSDGRAELTLREFEMVAQNLGSNVVQNWMINQFRRNSETLSSSWRYMLEARRA